MSTVFGIGLTPHNIGLVVLRVPFGKLPSNPLFPFSSLDLCDTDWISRAHWLLSAPNSAKAASTPSPVHEEYQ